MENNYILWNKSVQWEERPCFTLLQISLIWGLIEGSWILLSASVFGLLWYHILMPPGDSLYVYERTGVKKTKSFSVMWKWLWLCRPLKGPQGPWGSMNHAWRITGKMILPGPSLCTSHTAQGPVLPLPSLQPVCLQEAAWSSGKAVSQPWLVPATS